VKRLLSYSLVCLSLFVTLVTINTYSIPDFSKENSGDYVVQTSDQYYLSTAELPSGSFANESVNVNIGLQTTVSFQNSQFYLFRIMHSEKLVQQNIISSRHFYSSHRALIQKEGYYLFQLRKLLI